MNLSNSENLAIVDHLLTTTRSVRKRLDLSRPVPRQLIERCLELAIQAPTASNQQTWHFVVVTDPARRLQIADYYRRSWAIFVRRGGAANARREIHLDPEQMGRVRDSASYLAEHLHEVPVLVIPCVEGRVETSPVLVQASTYGSILPAVWSFMLALRARGVGAAWTTLHLAYEKEIAQALEIPPSVTQVALLPVAYYQGEDFKPAARIAAATFTHWDGWAKLPVLRD